MFLDIFCRGRKGSVAFTGVGAFDARWFLSCWGVSEDLGWAAQAGGVRCCRCVLRLQTREGHGRMQALYGLYHRICAEKHFSLDHVMVDGDHRVIDSGSKKAIVVAKRNLAGVRMRGTSGVLSDVVGNLRRNQYNFRVEDT